MVIRNVATLVVLGQSAAASAQHVTQLTGLEPTDWGEPGDIHVSATRHRPRRDGRPRQHALWQLEVDDDGSSGDDTGFASLRALATLVTDKADELRALQQDDNYEIRIDWGGFSDNGQGGFVLEPDLASQLGALGIPLYGTTYLTEQDDE